MRIDLVTDADVLALFHAIDAGNTSPDAEILNTIDVAYFAIAALYGTMRCFNERERTVRRDEIVRALVIESSQQIALAATCATSGATGSIKSEKIGNITTVYDSGNTSKASLYAASNGLASPDAARILLKFTRKFHMWNESNNECC